MPAIETRSRSRSTKLPRGCLVLALVVANLSACSVTVTNTSEPVPTTAASEVSYKATWARDWTTIIEASRPWNSANGAPGACDKGGQAQTCYATDQAVLPLLLRLRDDLSSVDVPRTYAAANSAMLAAINSEGQGLSDRDVGIRTNDDAMFSKAVDELAAAAGQLFTAYKTFPSADRPEPALFGPGKHAS